ncbi:MAG: HD domain-containing protein [Patescibacteria group bacterium]
MKARKVTGKKPLGPVADFLFEVGMLAKTPRSGFYFLGSGKQSVAEHIARTVYVGYVLVTLEGNVDMEKVLKMCLFHDLGEARTSDLNYVHQKYAAANEEKAIQDLAKTVSFGGDIAKLAHEFNSRATREAQVAKDADQLELILSLKEQLDIGNERAKTWIPLAVKRLSTASAKKLAQEIVKTDSDHWWFANKNDTWWVNRNKQR